MKPGILFLLCMTFVCSSVSSAEKIIWQGEVSSDGEPTDSIALVNRKKYQIKVKGFVNLGKWIQGTEKLANDACYEFGLTDKKRKWEAFKNSGDISVCDNSYHPDHTYQSEPFTAEQDRIHFWINDTYYGDNSGAFQVQVIELEE